MTLVQFGVWGVGECHRVVSGLHRRLSDFIHAVVVHRRDDAIRGWRSWIREDPFKGYVLIWFHLLRFFSVSLHLVVLGCLLTLLGLMRNSERLGFLLLSFWAKETSLEEFDHEVEGWLPLLPEVSLPRLTGQMLADVVQRKNATAGSLDGWGWRELKVLPVSWYDELARILTQG